MGAANSPVYPGPPYPSRRLHQAKTAPISKKAPTTIAIAMPGLAPLESPFEE